MESPVCGLLLLTGGIGWLLIRAMLRRSLVEDELRVAQQQLLDSNEQLERLAMHDALTGLANRRNFDDTLTQEAGRARRSGNTLSLMMIDIDHFKRYNDSYGHLAGDDCLQQVARRLSVCMRRPPDLLARYGGEEFAAILPDTDSAGAASVARTILEYLGNEPITHRDSPFAQVTVSIGIAYASGRDLENVQVLIARADQALYIAKNTGRNRLHID